MNAPLYTTEILRLAASLREPRELERQDGVAELRSPTCGSTIRTSVQLDEQGRIAAISQQVQACAFGQASAALMEAEAIGRSPAEVRDGLNALSAWLAGDDEQGPHWMSVTPLAPARRRAGRHAAILLPLRALLAAVEQKR
jgi:NifU-like protein involved in Fe-S cluster formation